MFFGPFPGFQQRFCLVAGPGKPGGLLVCDLESFMLCAFIVYQSHLHHGGNTLSCVCVHLSGGVRGEGNFLNKMEMKFDTEKQ